jgi:hypothetical protein
MFYFTSWVVIQLLCLPVAIVGHGQVIVHSVVLSLASSENKTQITWWQNSRYKRNLLFFLNNWYPTIHTIRLQILINKIFQDQDQFSGCLGSGSRSTCYSREQKKITRRENLKKNTYSVGHVGPADNENQVKMYKIVQGTSTLPLWNGKIRIRIKHSDPDPYQMETKDPDPYKRKAEPGSVSKGSGSAILHTIVNMSTFLKSSS